MLALVLVAVSVGFSNLAASIGIGVGGVTTATRIRVLVTFGLFEAGMPIVGLVLGQDLASDIGKQAKWLGALLLIGVGCYGVAGFVRNGGLSSLSRRRSQAPADQVLADQVLADQVLADQVLADQVLADQVPADQVLADQVPADETQVGVRQASGTAHSPQAIQAIPATQARQREWIKIGISGLALSLDNLIAGFALGGYQVNLVAGAILFGVVSIGMSLAGLEFGSRLGGWAGESGELIGGIVLIGVGTAIGLGVLG